MYYEEFIRDKVTEMPYTLELSRQTGRLLCGSKCESWEHSIQARGPLEMERRKRVFKKFNEKDVGTLRSMIGKISSIFRPRLKSQSRRG